MSIIICGLRSVVGIVWSSLLTIFVCAWVSLHPNIPELDEKWIKVALRRAFISIVAVIAPEAIIHWAASQHQYACALAKKHSERGWTKSHGFFAVMGGFMLYDGDRAIETLTPDELERLSLAGAIDFPTISRADIMDKSKGDAITKALVIGQTGWFIIQCLARAGLRLQITVLELVTVAYAALNFATYWFWWHKPSDVLRPVPVRLKHPLYRGNQERGDGVYMHDRYLADIQGRVPWSHAGVNESKELEGGVNMHDRPMVDTQGRIPQSYLGINESKELDKPIADTQGKIPLPYVGVGNSKETNGDVYMYNEGAAKIPDTMLRPYVDAKEIKQHDNGLFANNELATEMDVKVPRSYIVVEESRGHDGGMYMTNDLAAAMQRPLPLRPTLPAIVVKGIAFRRRVITALSADRTERKRIGTVYSGGDHISYSEIPSGYLSIVFGAFHLIAWSFPFPSRPERIMWRVSSLIITITPLTWQTVVLVYGGFPLALSSKPRYMVPAAVLLYSYVFARVFLIVLSFTSLRSLSPKALASVEWTSLLPHAT